MRSDMDEEEEETTTVAPNNEASDVGTLREHAKVENCCSAVLATQSIAVETAVGTTIGNSAE